MEWQWNGFTSRAINLFRCDCRLRTFKIDLLMLLYKAFCTKVMSAFHRKRFSPLIKEKLTFIARTYHLNSAQIINSFFNTFWDIIKWKRILSSIKSVFLRYLKNYQNMCNIPAFLSKKTVKLSIQIISLRLYLFI